MSTVYTPLPNEGFVTSPFTVTGATNATPIEITTSVNHGLATGEKVYIYQVAGNVAANKLWTITVTALNKFTLNTSVGSGAYTAATGFALPLGFATAETLPSDGDALNASSVNTPFEGAFNKVQSLAVRNPLAYLAQDTWQKPFNTWYYDRNPGVVWAAGVNANNAAWTECAPLNAQTQPGGFAISVADSYYDILPNDEIFITFTSSVDLASAASAHNIAFRISPEYVDYGVARTSAYSSFKAPSVQCDKNYNGPLVLHGHDKFTGQTRGRKMYLGLQAYGIGGAGTYNLVGDWCLQVQILRA